MTTATTNGVHPALQTRICGLFGVDLPVVQTGMGWVSGASLTAATSSAGGLGILAAVTMTVAELDAAIARVKERTDKPFGVNLRADQADVGDRINGALAAGVRVISFAGAPTRKLVDQIHDGDGLCVVTIGRRRHAEKMAKWGVDALIAQGGEGGGHTGDVPTTLLLPDVCAAVDIPVLGAGGFRDGRGLVAALALGADGIAMGTRFLLTKESKVPDATKAKYVGAGVRDTVVTKAIDGHPQRVIRTRVIDALERAGPLLRLPLAVVNALKFRSLTGTSVGDLVSEALAMRRNQGLTWSQTAMAANAPMLTRAAMVDGKLDAGILPTGQVAGIIDDLPTVAELLGSIMTEAEAVLRDLHA